VIRDDNFRETVRYTLQGIALMPFFTAVLSDNPRSLLRTALAWPAVVLIGRLSYSIYLFHLLARTVGEYYLGSPFRPESVIIGLVLTACVSYALFILVERPMARLRHRFRPHAGSIRTSQANAPEVDPPLAGLAPESGLGLK
jgi:peptidoglycan/LPS O-acetylase OafA/YrhL